MESTTFDVERIRRNRPRLTSQAGVPIDGFATVGGLPMDQARIHVVDPYGASATALTDASGYYQIPVEQGTWSVVCEGRDNGRDPTVTLPPQEVAEVGVVDLEYPVIPISQVQGSVDDADGKPAKGSIVRLVSQSLAGFDALNERPGRRRAGSRRTGSTTARWSRATTRSRQSLPPGTDKGDALTPALLEGIQFRQGYNSIPGDHARSTVRIDGSVDGANGHWLLVGPRPVPGGRVRRARATRCSPRGDAANILDVPSVPLTCEVVRSRINTRLASRRFPVDHHRRRDVRLRARPGETVDGQVLLEGVPEPYAVVEVRDAADNLLDRVYSARTATSRSRSISIAVADTP